MPCAMRAHDRYDSMNELTREFGDRLGLDVDPPTPVRASRAVRSYVIPGGTVRAHPSDHDGLVGLTVGVPRSFWREEDIEPNEPARIACEVVAECAQLFRHPDGTRCRTYLVAWRSQFFPIQYQALVDRCLTGQQRLELGLGR